MEALSAGTLLRKARLRQGLSRESLAIRAGTTQALVSDIEDGRYSPAIETLGELLELLGEELILVAKSRITGIDLTLNQGNLELEPDHRVQRGLAFADLVRQMRRGGVDDLGCSLQPAPIFLAFARHDVDFVVIGSIAGLVHGSAYPTYDLDVAYAGRLENLDRLAAALGEIGVQIDRSMLGEQGALSFDTEFGALDILRQVPGVETCEQLRRESRRELISGVAVPVASLDHLIAMKRAAGERKDQLMVLEYVELADEIRKREAEEKG
jgi:transcriptional regulator with XRE-family HTH domain